MSQHLRRHHKDLIKRCGLQNLVEEIKLYTQNEKGIIDLEKKSRCPDCGIYITSQNLGRHRKDKHKVNLREEKEEKMLLARETTEQAIRTENQRNILDFFEDHMRSFGGGNNKHGTSRSQRLGIEKILNYLDANGSPYTIVEEEKRQAISDFLSKESVRIPSGTKRLVEGLTNFGRFISANRLTEVRALNLNNDLESFRVQTSMWTRSFMKVKKKTNAKLRDRLDETLMSNEDNTRLKQALLAEKKKIGEKSSQENLASFIALYFCFGEGNANRADIIKNAKVSEYLCWKENCENKEAEFKVRKS